MTGQNLLFAIGNSEVQVFTFNEEMQLERQELSNKIQNVLNTKKDFEGNMYG